MSEHDSTRNILRKAFLSNFKPFANSELIERNLVFICTRCKKQRCETLREGDRPSCRICNAYKSHKKKKIKTKPFDMFEVEFLARENFRFGKQKKCIECLEIKPKDQFKNKGSYCIDCWYGDEQSKVRALRKLMREPFRGRNNNKSFEFAFGYTVNQLKEHLIKQFTDGMTWDCVLNNEIHIDHIIPASAFDHNNDKHVAYCWSLQNLQPLWAKDNLAKADYLSNGDKVQTIRKQPDARQRLDDLLCELYGFEA